MIKPLSKKLSLLRLSNDEVRKVIYDLSVTITLEDFTKIMTTLLKKYLEMGYSIAIDGDCASAITQKLISDRQKEYSLNVVWVHINPPEDFIINKLKNYNHTWLFRNGEEAIKNYLERKEVPKNLTMPFVYTFDTSSVEVDNQIIEAVDVINKEVKK